MWECGTDREETLGKCETGCEVGGAGRRMCGTLSLFNFTSQRHVMDDSVYWNECNTSLTITFVVSVANSRIHTQSRQLKYFLLDFSRSRHYLGKNERWFGCG